MADAGKEGSLPGQEGSRTAPTGVLGLLCRFQFLLHLLDRSEPHSLITSNATSPPVKAIMARKLRPVKRERTPTPVACAEDEVATKKVKAGVHSDDEEEQEEQEGNSTDTEESNQDESESSSNDSDEGEQLPAYWSCCKV